MHPPDPWRRVANAITSVDTGRANAPPLRPLIATQAEDRSSLNRVPIATVRETRRFPHIRNSTATHPAAWRIAVSKRSTAWNRWVIDGLPRTAAWRDRSTCAEATRDGLPRYGE